MTAESADELGQKVRDIHKKIDEIIEACRKAIEKTLGWVPDSLAHLVAPISLGLDKLIETANWVMDWLAELFRPANLENLRKLGEDWTDQIKTPLGDTAESLGPNNLMGNVQWTGRAAKAYGNLIPNQIEGLASLQGIAERIRASVNSMTDAFEAYRTAVTAIGVAFLAAIVSAFATFLTVATAAVGMAEVVMVTAALVTAISYFGWQVATTYQALESQQRDLRQEASDITTRWSKSKFSDLSDGSVSDGDKSEWRPEE